MAARRRRAVGIVLGALAALALVTAVAPAGAATAPCPTATYAGTAYCVATITDLDAGAYRTGQRVVLRGVMVSGSSGTVRILASLVPEPCPPGHICGALMITVGTTVDFRSSPPAPPDGYYADVYGTVTTTPTTMRPRGYVLGGPVLPYW